MPPVLPQHVEALLGSESDTFCVRLVALGELSWLIFKFMRWMINEDGTDFSDDFKTWLCTIQCTEETDLTTP